MTKKKFWTRRRGDRTFSLMLIFPSFLMITAFILIPIVDSVIKSLQDYKIKNIISGSPGVWNSFANYAKLFRNAKLLQAIGNTFLFVVVTVLLAFLGGMILALLLDSGIRGAKIIQGVMLIPWVIPTVISALIWLWLYQPQYGLFRYLVSVVTGGVVADLSVLNNPRTALLGICAAALWKQIPLTALLLLAGLQNLPKSLEEAGTVDGANWRQRLFYIVLPNMKTVIGVVVSMSIIENFKQFPLFWTMTGGGPDGATTTLAILSYREAFVSQNLGSGAAVTTVWMGLMLVVVLIYNRLMRTDDAEI